MFYFIRPCKIDLTIIVINLFYKEELKRLHFNWAKKWHYFVLIRSRSLFKILSNRFLFFGLNILSLLGKVFNA